MVRVGWIWLGGVALAIAAVGCGDDGATGGNGAGSEGGGGDAEGGGGAPDAGGGGAAQGGMAEGGGGGTPALTLDEACDHYASQWCSKRDECTDGHFIAVNYGDVATCETRQAQQCVLRGEAPGTSFDAEGFDQCAEDLEGLSCADLRNGELPESCVPGEGEGAEGDACAFGAQCGTTFCESSTTEACGVCADAPIVGTSCEDDTGCGAGARLKCDEVTLTCVEPAGEGESCNSNATCLADLSCVGASEGVAGTCEPAGTTIGAACDPQAETAADCERSLGLRCVAGACEHVHYAAEGEPCGVLDDGVAVCLANGSCEGDPGARECVAAAIDGEACDVESGPACAAPANCIVSSGTSGVCALLDAGVCD